MARQNVDFSVQSNTPVVILLDDGTEIKMQYVPTRIFRTDEKLPDGQWRHEVQGQLIMDQMGPAGEIDVKALAKEGSK